MIGSEIENISETTQTEATDMGAIRKRERSTIEFPYGDLESAIELAETIHTHAGVECIVDHLAGWAGKPPTSGTFRMRLATARTFGLIETERGGRIYLTDRGRKIVNPETRREARIEAFLGVPLYEAIYNRYKGYQLPPQAALERQITEFGVSQKQKDKARQAFQRSAQQAGFFEKGTDRLTVPGLPTGPGTKPIDGLPKGNHETGGGGSGGGNEPPDLDPIIAGLLARLPKPGSKWPKAQREVWLQLFKGSFDLIYEDNEPNEKPSLPDKNA